MGLSFEFRKTVIMVRRKPFYILQTVVAVAELWLDMRLARKLARGDSGSANQEPKKDD